MEDLVHAARRRGCSLLVPRVQRAFCLAPCFLDQTGASWWFCGGGCSVARAWARPCVAACLAGGVTALYSGCVSQVVPPLLSLEQPAPPVIRSGVSAVLQPAALAIQFVGMTPPWPARGCRLRCCFVVGVASLLCGLRWLPKTWCYAAAGRAGPYLGHWREPRAPWGFVEVARHGVPSCRQGWACPFWECLVRCVLRAPLYTQAGVCSLGLLEALAERFGPGLCPRWDPDPGLWPCCPTAWLLRVVPAAGGETELCGLQGVTDPPVIRVWVWESLCSAGSPCGVTAPLAGCGFTMPQTGREGASLGLYDLGCPVSRGPAAP
ncbi:uncharacterized protein LOC125692533 [Lagopus muta]|uniref:uncharacterized protein LOC125692533 n=1 Tax=Lagopus muta TaxID=64668 RepID=UPI0020A06885|nr:uncharacterized protein LOC125692533 [Lagopus muta]XP_048799120.1 uncharacterized protein LOC125692533 [Lagopus muta]XP_048799121.1 uncharacterized protein LOC125692533 [Lagopus muta]XP_048799122.1 uncharacterized protein LOC125692533 [Lagopus muta]